MWIPRQLAPSLRELAATFPAVVVVGPRQVGKTSLLERTFPNHRYTTLDLPSQAELAETRPQEFLERFPPPVVLDEIQYAPALFRHLKTVIDSRRDERGLFLLTGSQDFPLMRSVSDSLAGRAAVVRFQSLSAAEWSAVDALTEHSDWRDFVWRGGFPALWSQLDASPSRERWYQGYLATYLERDVRNLVGGSNLRDFERFLRACAARTGQLLNVAELGRDVGVTSPTARGWLDALQASGQIHLLEPYHRSLGQRLVKSPKLYFTDTGLASFLLGFGSADALWSSPSAGALFENHVVAQWLRWRDWTRPSASLWFWRDAKGGEVDLLIEADGMLHAVECKITESPRPRDGRGIAQLRELYGPQIAPRAFIACTAALPYDLASDGETTLSAVPGWIPWPLDASSA